MSSVGLVGLGSDTRGEHLTWQHFGLKAFGDVGHRRIEIGVERDVLHVLGAGAAKTTSRPLVELAILARIENRNDFLRLGGGGKLHLARKGVLGERVVEVVRKEVALQLNRPQAEVLIDLGAERMLDNKAIRHDAGFRTARADELLVLWLLQEGLRNA